MNKLVCGILTVILCLTAVGALAQESDLPEVRWTYPVSLTEIQSKYAMLVNADNMLEKDFEPDPLVKVTGVKRATSAAVYLEETAAKDKTLLANAQQRAKSLLEEYIKNIGEAVGKEYKIDWIHVDASGNPLGTAADASAETASAETGAEMPAA